MQFREALALGAALVIAGATTAQAQSLLPLSSVDRLKWGTANALIRSDTARGLEIWVHTSVFWKGPVREFSARLDPAVITDWLERANTIATTHSSPPSATAVLIDTVRALDGSLIAIERRSAGDHWSDRGLVVMKATGAAEPWAMDVELKSLTEFVRTVFIQSGRSALKAPVPGPAGTTVVQFASDSPPQALKCGTLLYPPQMSGSGEVWTEYVVEENGMVNPSDITILLSDDPSFTRSAVDEIRSCHYAPGMVDGHPIRTLVRQAIIFKMGR